MILLCYDGSPGARAAVDLAATAMAGTEVTVLTVWESFADLMARSSAVAGGWLAPSGSEDYGELDRASEQAARDLAAEGVQRALDGGLRAQARVVSRRTDVGESILAEAADIDADLIVVGTRGRGDVGSFLLGSVSHHLVHHADRAVTVVPSRELIDRRSHLQPAGDARRAPAPQR
jgi:nucleotide-binding universal stress UspA family protein